jgi:hypothetical protein
MREPFYAIRFTLLAALALTTLFFLVAPAHAQETSQGVTTGLAFNNNASPQVQGWATYDKQLKGKLFSYSGIDISPIKQENTFIPKLKFTAFSGFALQSASIGKLSLWIIGAPGLATTGDETGIQGSVGGFGHYRLGRGWGIIVGAQGNFSSIQNTDATLRFGFRYGVK